jgi:hypothetical protein
VSQWEVLGKLWWGTEVKEAGVVVNWMLSQGRIVNTGYLMIFI